jgi:nucleoid-associated protein YgaU
MKKILFASLIILFFLAGGLFAQSLYDNEYYKQSLEYSGMAETALDEGEYDKSYEYAVKSREFAALSRAYIAEMTKAYRARTSLSYAKERIELARRVNLDNNDPDLYNEAFGLFTDSKADFDVKKYDDSLEKSQKVIELLKNVKGGTMLPAFYEVILNVESRDCLWKIAGYDFVYGDPRKWPKLYEANRATMPEPDNPDLIHPGQILRIPPLKGELREGTHRK